MKRQLRYFFVLLFIVLFAYLLRPSSEHLDKIIVLKGISLAKDYKTAVNDYLVQHKQLPVDEAATALMEKIYVNLDESAVSRITIGDNGAGSITIYYTSNKLPDTPPEIHDKQVVLKADVYGEKISWNCRGTVPVEFLPVACQ